MLHAVPLLAATRATWPDILVFAAAAAVILVGAVGVVTSRNPVHAALSLVMTLFGVAVLFIEQEADFLAAVQIIVYAGAIVVLFLFVIMFLGVDRAEDITIEPLVGQRPLAFLFSAITLAGVLAMAATAHWVTGARQVVGPIQGHVAGPTRRRASRPSWASSCSRPTCSPSRPPPPCWSSPSSAPWCWPAVRRRCTPSPRTAPESELPA